MDKNKTVDFAEMSKTVDDLNKNVKLIQDKHKEAIDKFSLDNAKEMGEHKDTINKMVKDVETKMINLESLINRQQANQNVIVDNKRLEYNKKYFNSIAEHCVNKQALKDLANSPEDQKLARSALNKFLGCSNAMDFARRLTPEETKAFNTIIDNQGGYFVVPEYSTEVVQKQFDMHEVLNVIDTQTVSSSQFSELADWNEYSDAEFKNQLVSAPTPATETNYQKITWNVKTMLYPKKFTRDSLEDSGIDIENYVLGKLREGMVRKKAYMVMYGTGSDQPRGLLTYASGTERDQIEQKTSTSAGVIVWDDVLKVLPGALTDGYHVNASFAMKRQTFLSLLTDVDGMGRYQIGSQVQFLSNTKAPLLVMGYPVLKEAYMETVATAGKAVLFGDFKRAYKLVIKIGQSIIRDDVSDPQNVTTTLRERLDAKLVDGNALKMLVIQ